MGSRCAGNVATGAYHSHGEYDPKYDNENLSFIIDENGRVNGDIPWSMQNGLPLSLGTPGGRVMIYDPGQNCQAFYLGSPIGTFTNTSVCP